MTEPSTTETSTRETTEQQRPYVPPELAALDQWLMWRHEERDGTVTKVPYRTNGMRASSTDPLTWTAFEEAYAAFLRGARAAKGAPQFSGIGFVVTKDDPIVGVDLDHCVNKETKDLEQWAADIVRELDSYSEISPSGTGVRIFATGTLPPRGRKRGRIEMYDRQRFLTFTSDPVGGSLRPLAERTDELAALHARVFPASGTATQAAGVPLEPPRPVPLTDEEILERARTAANGEKFRRLFDEGDTSGHDDDDSVADLALCQLLSFWTGPDPERIDRLFRSSKLYRGKWERDDYRERTIQKAVERTTEWFTPGLAFSERSSKAAADATRAAGTAMPRPSSVVSILDLLEQPMPAWQVEGMLYEHSLVGLIGEPGSFKSFVALDLALSMAAGLPWLGQAVQQAPTLYISGEGQGGLRKRSQAWAAARGIDLPRTFYVRTYAVQFLLDEQLDELIEDLDALPEPPRLIVVDTLSRCFVGGEENAAKDMGRFIWGVDRLRAHLGASALVLHHVTKNSTTPRGSTAFLGALDTQMDLKREEAGGQKTDQAVLSCSKQKDAEEFRPIGVRARLVSAGPDVTSLVLDRTDLAPQVSLNGTADRVCGVLSRCFGDGGATLAEWAGACQEQEGIPETTVGRYRKLLIDGGRVEVREGETGRGVKYRAVGAACATGSSTIVGDVTEGVERHARADALSTSSTSSTTRRVERGGSGGHGKCEVGASRRDAPTYGHGCDWPVSTPDVPVPLRTF